MMLERGILTAAYGNRVRICPPLVIDEPTLIGAVDVIEEAMESLLERNAGQEPVKGRL